MYFDLIWFDLIWGTGTWIVTSTVYRHYMRQYGGNIVNIVADMWNGYLSLSLLISSSHFYGLHHFSLTVVYVTLDFLWWHIRELHVQESWTWLKLSQSNGLETVSGKRTFFFSYKLSHRLAFANHNTNQTSSFSLLIIIRHLSLLSA
jgi:hypothetical protein